MDMTTEHTDGEKVFSEKDYRDLEKRLQKAEDKLAKAKTRAQATMQEIWQLDVRLKEEEDRANRAETRLTELGQGVVEPTPEVGDLTRQLQAAEARAAQADDLEDELVTVREELDALRAVVEAAPTEAVDTQAIVALREELQQAQEELLKAQEGSRQAQEDLAQVQEESRRVQEELARVQEESQQAPLQLSVSPEAFAPAHDDELAQARLDGLRIQLHEAEEKALEAERKLSELGSSAGVFSDQLLEIQNKVREAEERALDWEERFHRSQERAQAAEAALGQPSFEGDTSGGDSDLSQRVRELESEVEYWKSSSATAEVEDLDQEDEITRLRAELADVTEKLLDYETRPEGQGSPELDTLRSQLAEALEQAERWEREAQASGGSVFESEDADAIESYKERLQLAEERAELLQLKADQASAQLAELQAADSERQELRNRLARAESLLADTQERLTKAQQAASSASEQVHFGGSPDEAVRAMEGKLQDAYKRARESDLKAGQAEIQLQKAMVSLKEYEQRANESDRETQRLAFQDSLTGLPNLNLIRQYLDFTVKQVQRYQRASALLIVDIDRFKLINDSMGMKAGDELLMKVAERLQSAIRESDALGRKGEDEFLILLSELFTGDESVSPEQKTQMIRQNIAIVVNRISEGLSRPFVIQGQKFYVRASIGVSVCPNDADTSQAMLEHADSAMYHAKESGRGRCVFYNSELHKRQERRLAMDSQLRLAMEKGEFALLYQPIIEITKGKGQIVGVEALLRWNHRIDGMLAPASFLSIAEETGVIVQLGQWVCRQACWQLRQWLSQGANLFVAFNVSTRQMLQADLSEVILGSVEEFGLQPGLVFVEIREGSNVEEVDLIERVVSNLGKSGIRVAIDDFGVGYSSLSRLDLQHIQFLKIDPSLVSGSQQDKAKANICEAAVRLAQSLEIKPLAEGVETLAQAKFLAKIGCQFMQGYHIHEPCTADEMTRLLAERRAWKF